MDDRELGLREEERIGCWGGRDVGPRPVGQELAQEVSLRGFSCDVGIISPANESRGGQLQFLVRPCGRVQGGDGADEVSTPILPFLLSAADSV